MIETFASVVMAIVFVLESVVAGKERDDQKKRDKAFMKLDLEKDKLNKNLRTEEMYGYGSSIYKNRRDQYNNDLHAKALIDKGYQNPDYYDNLKYDPEKHQAIRFGKSSSQQEREQRQKQNMLWGLKSKSAADKEHKMENEVSTQEK